jgi:hypothetical protein
MVYSPGIVLIRDDNGEWLSPVEVDVLTSAAVNAGEIRRELEREERLRLERVVMEYWKKRGEERREENERAIAERQRLREENKNAKEEIPMLKSLKELQADLVKLQKLQEEIIKEMDKGRAVAEVESEDEKGEEVEVEKPEEIQENTIDSTDNGLGCGSDRQLKGAEENTESKGNLIQYDQPQPEAPPKVNQEPDFSNIIVHPHPPLTQPSQAPSNSTYALALKNAEIQIEQIMYARISRILHLFQLHQTPHLILGSFGTGVFKNRIDLVATIFADLLVKPGGRFKDVFQTVVFAILGKETVRVFSEVFSRVDKRAQSEGTGKTRVFVDLFGSEGGDEKTTRTMGWKARSELERSNSYKYDIPDAAPDTASFDPARFDAAPHPLSFDAAQTNVVSYRTSSAPTDVASYAPSFDVTDATYAASSIATQTSEVANAASSNAVQASAAVNAAACAPPFDTAQADAAASTAYSNAAQACAVASAAFSTAAQACAAADQADEVALHQGSAAAYAASSNAWRSSYMCSIPGAAGDATSFDPAQIDAAFHPLSFDAAQATSSTAAQASVSSYLPSFDATKASVMPYPTSLTAAQCQADAVIQANPTAVDNYGIPEDVKMILTKDDEQVDFVAGATANVLITPKAMVVDDGKDVELIENKSEAQSLKSNKKEDGDDESAPC